MYLHIKYGQYITVKKLNTGGNYYQLLLLKVGGNQQVLLINFYNNIPKAELIKAVEDLNNILHNQPESGQTERCVILTGDYNCHLCPHCDSGTCGLVNLKEDPSTHFEHTMIGNLLNNLLHEWDLGFANEFCNPQVAFHPTFIWSGLQISDRFYTSYHKLSSQCSAF